MGTKVEFTATTLTSKGRFGKGDVSNLFTDKEAKDLQRLSSVKSPAPTVKKPKAKVKIEAKKEKVKDEPKDISEK